MTALFEFLLGVGLSLAICLLGIRLFTLGLFYVRRWRVQREYSKLDRLSLESVARMGRKDQ